MASPFSITVPSGVVPLQLNGVGDVQFSVTNAGTVALRGRATLVPLDGLDAAWLVIQGDAERDFAVNGTQPYIVRVTLPPGTPPARRRFRLDVIGVANPDEIFTQGQAVFGRRRQQRQVRRREPVFQRLEGRAKGAVSHG